MEILLHYARRSHAPIHPNPILKEILYNTHFMRNVYIFVVPFFREFNEPHAFVISGFTTLYVL